MSIITLKEYCDNFTAEMPIELKEEILDLAETLMTKTNHLISFKVKEVEENLRIRNTNYEQQVRNEFAITLNNQKMVHDTFISNMNNMIIALKARIMARKMTDMNTIDQHIRIERNELSFIESQIDLSRKAMKRTIRKYDTEFQNSIKKSKM